MRKNTSEFAGNSSIHHFYNVEVSGEEDVEVSLMYLYIVLLATFQTPRKAERISKRRKKMKRGKENIPKAS